MRYVGAAFPAKRADGAGATMVMGDARTRLFDGEIRHSIAEEVFTLLTHDRCWIDAKLMQDHLLVVELARSQMGLVLAMRSGGVFWPTEPSWRPQGEPR